MPEYKVGRFWFRRIPGDERRWEVLAPDKQTRLSTHDIGNDARKVCELLRDGIMKPEGIDLSLIPDAPKSVYRRSGITYRKIEYPSFLPLTPIAHPSYGEGVIYQMAKGSKIPLATAAFLSIPDGGLTTVDVRTLTQLDGEVSFDLEMLQHKVLQLIDNVYFAQQPCGMCPGCAKDRDCLNFPEAKKRMDAEPCGECLGCSVGVACVKNFAKFAS